MKSDHHTLPLHHRLKTAVATFAMTAALASTTLAHDAKQMLEKSILDPEPQGAKVNLLLSVNLSDKYVTPRGQIVRDEGLTIQPLLLAFLTLHEGDGWLSHFKFFGGVWCDFGTDGVSEQPPYGSDPKTNFTEIDPILGVSFGIAKTATLDVTYTAFVEEILNIPTSHHINVKLSINDSKLLGAFALNPYFLYWKELEQKSTAAQVPFNVFGRSPNTGSDNAPDEGYYFEAGIEPGYTIPGLDLKLTFPCRILLPSNDFFGDFYADNSTVGLYEVGAKAQLPLKFMPRGYGNWTATLGYRYMNFVDENLQGMNEFNSPGKATEEVHQIYGGISVFF